MSSLTLTRNACRCTMANPFLCSSPKSGLRLLLDLYSSVGNFIPVTVYSRGSPINQSWPDLLQTPRYPTFPGERNSMYPYRPSLYCCQYCYIIVLVWLVCICRCLLRSFVRINLCNAVEAFCELAQAFELTSRPFRRFHLMKTR